MKLKYLYNPKGPAGEYARWALNYYKGCTFGCVYCYAAQRAAKFGQVASRADFHCPEKIGVKKGFTPGALRRELEDNHTKIDSRPLLNFTHDPFQPIEDELHFTRDSIKALHAFGVPVQVLTKNPSGALQHINLFDERDAVAATLTFPADDAGRSLFWEPCAPIPASRYVALERFHAAGIQTWVSLEPVVDPAATLQIIRETNGFVSHYKIGKINYENKLPETHVVGVTAGEWARFYYDVTALLEKMGYTFDPSSSPKPKTFNVKDSLLQYVSTPL